MDILWKSIGRHGNGTGNQDLQDFEAAGSRAPGAHPVTHENVESSSWIGGGIGIGVGFDIDIDCDRDPDTDPEGSWIIVLFSEQAGEVETMEHPQHRIVILQGDITLQNVDAIVNAANTSLLGGGGVDGAIHRAAGPGLLEECRKLGGCPTGGAKITRGHNLPARWVIHTVGPVWRGGAHKEDELLALCYQNSLQLAREHHLATVAFPSISTGIYAFPVERACRIALRTIRSFLDEHPLPERVAVICFDRHTYDSYQKAIAMPD